MIELTNGSGFVIIQAPTKLKEKQVEMRLWHQALLPYLDKKRLLGQHRECCALRGKWWGRKHATVDYVFKHGLDHLYAYHCLVMHEMMQQFNANINIFWYDRLYRGENLRKSAPGEVGIYIYLKQNGQLIYPEHDDKYLKECLLNLKSKGAELVNGKTVNGMLIDLDLKGIA